MPTTHPLYAPAYRRQMVELVFAGRTPGELAREFECSASAIRNWVCQNGTPAGCWDHGGGRAASTLDAITSLHPARSQVPHNAHRRSAGC